MIYLHIAKPMPIPVSLVVKKLSKRRGRCSGSIPGPLSSILQYTLSGSASTVLREVLRLAGVSRVIAWTAFMVRLTMTCWS